MKIHFDQNRIKSFLILAITGIVVCSFTPAFASANVNGDVVSMLTRLRFKRLQNRARGC